VGRLKWGNTCPGCWGGTRLLRIKPGLVRVAVLKKTRRKNLSGKRKCERGPSREGEDKGLWEWLGGRFSSTVGVIKKRRKREAFAKGRVGATPPAKGVL